MRRDYRRPVSGRDSLVCLVRILGASEVSGPGATVVLCGIAGS